MLYAGKTGSMQKFILIRFAWEDNMKLLFLFGDGAVGKMTVGQELAKITDFRLFHNHMTIEPVLEIFGSFHNKAISRLREVIFEEFAASEGYGLIFTYLWAFDQKSDWDYIEQVKEIFRKYNAEFYYVELDAPQEIRLQRNRTENRLKQKASKRNLARSDQMLIDVDQRYRCVSFDGEIPFENYLRIENSNLSAQAAAQKIKEHFNF
jgi:shikimate kinase